MTVVEMPGEQTGDDAPVVKDAAKIVEKGGAIRFDIPHSVRAVYGANSALLGEAVVIPTWHYFTTSNGRTGSRGSPRGGWQAELDAVRFHQSLG
jgi:hypothetical protein